VSAAISTPNYVAELSDNHGATAVEALRFPRVQALKYWGAAWLVDMLPRVGPHLMRLSFDWPAHVQRRQRAERGFTTPTPRPYRSIDADELTRLLHQTSREVAATPSRLLSIRDLNGCEAESERLLHDVFCAAARLPELKKLLLQQFFPLLKQTTVEAAALAATVCSDVALQPFRRLRALDTLIELEAVPPFVAILPSLKSLCLAVYKYRSTLIMRAVAPLTQLQSLSLKFSSQRRVAAGDLLALISLTCLRMLSLSCSNATRVPDDCYRQLMPKLPHLRALHLGLVPPVESHLLRTCGVCCPQLRELLLWCSFCFASLVEQSDVSLFPMLEKLNIGRLTRSNNLTLR
jgi:hypothetical protein